MLPRPAVACVLQRSLHHSAQCSRVPLAACTGQGCCTRGQTDGPMWSGCLPDAARRPARWAGRCTVPCSSSAKRLLWSRSSGRELFSSLFIGKDTLPSVGAPQGGHWRGPAAPQRLQALHHAGHGSGHTQGATTTTTTRPQAATGWAIQGAKVESHPTVIVVSVCLCLDHWCNWHTCGGGGPRVLPRCLPRVCVCACASWWWRRSQPFVVL